jgi:16S rRNA (adenine1518-N6/adenine1519-N6)-dimethyltransferase
MSRPKLGQHWLDDKRYSRDIVDSIGADRENTVIEIGGGRGALTRYLIPISGRLIVYEIDNKWAEHLKEHGPRWDDSGRGFSHVEIRQLDALKIIWDRESLGLKKNERVIICGNLPYYITSPLLLRLAYSRMDFDRAIFLIQKEVAEKITSVSNSSDYGRLTVSLRAFLSSEILLDVPPEAFLPKPKVMSSLIRLVPHKTQLINPEIIESFERVIQISFHMRRKTLKNNLIAGFPQKSPDEIERIIAETGANPNARAQELTVRDFIKITELLS